MSTQDPFNHLPLKPRTFLILAQLLDGPTHGYALKESLLRSTNGRLNLGPGTLYRTIQQLLDDGLIVELVDHDGDERRRTYEITRLGRDVVQAEAARLQTVVANVHAHADPS